MVKRLIFRRVNIINPTGSLYRSAMVPVISAAFVGGRLYQYRGQGLMKLPIQYQLSP